MSDYLKKPTLRPFVTIEKGDKIREGQQQVMHLAKPLASNADVPTKSPEMEKVEVPNPKVLDAKDKNKGPAGKVAKPAEGLVGRELRPKRGPAAILSLCCVRGKSLRGMSPSSISTLQRMFILPIP